MILSYIKTLRPHQWIKNLLVFLPLIASHSYTSAHSIYLAALTFIIFSLAASAVYIFNDIADLQYDKRHPIKKNRPLASGRVSKYVLIIMIPTLIGISLSLCLIISNQLTYLLGLYLITNFLYSKILKSIAVVDILILTLFYVMRIISGAIAINVFISAWLIAFSIFLFLSLAAAKRYAELSNAKKDNRSCNNSRGYSFADKEFIYTTGLTSGLLSVLVLALYVNSQQAEKLYTNPIFLWGICPIILTWILRMWLLLNRFQVDEDPVIYTLQDKWSYVSLILFIVFFLLATT